MKATWIGNGSLVLPDRVIPGGSVLMENGKIAAVNRPCPENVERVDVHGMYIMAGFIDLHVHGGGGFDFMDCDEEEYAQIAGTHMRHGTTALAATTMTCPDEQLERVLDCFQRASARQTGAKLLGLHLEGPFFSAASKGAQPIKQERVPTREMLEHMIALGHGKILRWDAAPELPNMDVFAAVMREHGILCALAHSQANATQAAWAFDHGFSHVTHFYNALTTFHKENGIVHAGSIEETYLRDDVTIELIGDGRHIPKESMRLALKIKGADNIALITDAMRAAGTDAKTSILGARQGGTPVVIKDDVAQLMDLSSYAGSICTMDRALRTAHLDYGIPLPEVSVMLSLTPARLSFCADQKGSLEKGKDADVVILTDTFHVQRVYIAGEKTFQAS